MRELAGEPPHVVAQRMRELNTSLHACVSKIFFFFLLYWLTACTLITEFNVQNPTVRVAYGMVLHGTVCGAGLRSQPCVVKRNEFDSGDGVMVSGLF